MRFWNKHFPSLTLEQEQGAYNEASKHVSVSDLYEGAVEFLKYLKNKEIRLFIVSSDPRNEIMKVLRENSLFDLFDDIITGVHDKEQYCRETIRKFKLDKSSTMYLGDTAGDIELAQNIGMISAGISWGFNTEEVLRKAKPDFLFRDLDQVKELIEKQI